MSYSLLKDGGLYERGGEAEEPGAGPAHQEGLPAGEGDRQAAPPWHRDQQAPPSGLVSSKLSGLAEFFLFLSGGSHLAGKNDFLFVRYEIFKFSNKNFPFL